MMLLLLFGLLLVGGYFLLHVTVLKLPRCKSSAKLDGKTAVVTGESTAVSQETITPLNGAFTPGD